MRTRALARRILHQMRRDRRTLALMFFAPILLLSLVFLLLNSTTATVRIAVVSAPEAYVERLYENNIIPVRMEAGEARRALGRQPARTGPVTRVRHQHADRRARARCRLRRSRRSAGRRRGQPVAASSRRFAARDRQRRGRE